MTPIFLSLYKDTNRFLELINFLNETNTTTKIKTIVYL